ncbi:MAG: hypothetical protein LBE32_00555 [Burkholderiales bacterium]|jgi:hypothetical protein|nr:hypothetical protein [Burkholderiales bacterium]
MFDPQEYNYLRQLWLRLNPDRVVKLDLLDEAISSRLSLTDAQTAFAALSTLVQTRAMPQKIIVLETPGTGNFVVPPGVYMISISMCAGGGGAIYANGGSSNRIVSTGGSGASIVDVDVPVTPGQVMPYTVGTGGISTVITAAPNSYTEAAGGGSTEFAGLTCLGGNGGRVYWNQGTSPTGYAVGGGIFRITAGDISNSSVFGQSNPVVISNNNSIVPGAGGSVGTSNTQQVPITPLFLYGRAGAGGFVTFGSNNTVYAMDHGRNGVIVIKMQSAS